MKNLRVSLSTLAAASLLTLAPVAARADAATDGQLAADHAAYRAQQQAIADLNATGRHGRRCTHEHDGVVCVHLLQLWRCVCGERSQ